jgi:hypothetical protein
MELGVSQLRGAVLSPVIRRMSPVIRRIGRIIGIALCRHPVHRVVTVASDNPSCVYPLFYIAVRIVGVGSAPWT